MAQTAREKELNDLLYGNAMGYQSMEKPEYAGTYEDRLNELFDKISNREKFSYDVSKDPLYGAYKDEYIQQGKLAMKDTMGQAAALTGGYGNTYGQQVGQQAYDAYLQKLSAAIPQLYGMAYNMYQDEGNNLKDLYGMVGAQRDAEYGRYRDELKDWEYGQDVLRQMEQQEYSRRMDEESIARQLEQQEYERKKYEEQIQRQLEEQAYSRRMQEESIQRQMEQQEYERRKYDEEVQRKMDQQAWERQQQAYSNLYAIIKASGYSPSDEELAAAGMSREQAAQIASEFNRQILNEDLERDYKMYGGSGGSSGGGSSGGRSYSSGGSSGGSSGRSSGNSGGYSYNYDYAPVYSYDDEIDAITSAAPSAGKFDSVNSAIEYARYLNSVGATNTKEYFAAQDYVKKNKSTGSSGGRAVR